MYGNHYTMETSNVLLFGVAETSNALLFGVAKTNNHPLQTDGELTSSVLDKLQPVWNPFEGMIISFRF